LRGGVPNKNTVARLKSNIIISKFWAGYPTASESFFFSDRNLLFFRCHVWLFFEQEAVWKIASFFDSK